MNRLDPLVRELRSILRTKNDGAIQSAEKCLAAIATLNEQESLERLLDLFDDSASDEMMFLIVHAIERWDDRTYSTALFRSVERLWASAPRWTQILHIRVMNSQRTADAYFELVVAGEVSKRTVVQRIYEAIGKGWPKLTDKTIPIVTRLRSLGGSTPLIG